jgi:hypothetical protein
MRVLLVPALFASSALPQTFGVWKLDTVRSVLAGGATPKSLVVRVESHPKGEVFTLDTVAADGRRTSSSTILYFDGASRDLRDFDCQGTQSSRRLDSQTVGYGATAAQGDRSVCSGASRPMRTNWFWKSTNRVRMDAAPSDGLC